MAKIISFTPDQQGRQPEPWLLEKLMANDEKRWREAKKRHIEKLKASRSKKAS